MKPKPVGVPGFSDKSSKDPELVRLYESNPFLVAYAQHTDLRVEDDPHTAIGGRWEEYGELSRNFLIAQGLEPYHRFLDFGCGTGRLARKLVPYLESRHYFGCDISRGALNHARRLSEREGWADKLPTFVWGHAPLPPCDFVWAFAVFMHLPPEEVQGVFRCVRTLMHKGSRFLFSYSETDRYVRTGLKQFKHPWAFYERCAADNELTVARVDGWTGRQSIAQATR